jgi:hypothetical protein
MKVVQDAMTEKLCKRHARQDRSRRLGDLRILDARPHPKTWGKFSIAACP